MRLSLPRTHTHTSRAATEKPSFLPLWKAHCSHTFVWFLPCSDQQSPLCLWSCRRAAEGRVLRTARDQPRDFQTRGCALQLFPQMRGCQAACWSHRKKSMIESGSSLDAQLLGRLFTWSKISVEEEKEANWIQMGDKERWLWKISRSISKIIYHVLSLLSPQLSGKGLWNCSMSPSSLFALQCLAPNKCWWGNMSANSISLNEYSSIIPRVDKSKSVCNHTKNLLEIKIQGRMGFN